MWTVSRLAKRCGLSRSTLLYYESIGLLKPARRNASNYRGYTDRDLVRLQQVCAYRNAGLKLEDILALLDRPETDAAAVLKRRLLELDAEIETKRSHQRAILLLLKDKNAMGANRNMTKEKWTSIMRSAGLNEADMHRWHIEFERSAPDDHQQFLEFLHIPPEEIQSIRNWSREAQAQS
jgi:MerR family transcriptional regulator, thiopeptide resistance regulator